MSTHAFDTYAGLKAVNWSSLKSIGRSPLHYQNTLVNGRPDTPAMRLGRAIHCATLEPDEFPLLFVVYDERRGTNAYKEFVVANPARTILTRDEYETALAVRDAVHGHKVARRLLRYGRPEVTLQWVDRRTHIRCKARLDWLRGDQLTDLKSTRDVDARDFGRTAARLEYHGQLAFYRMGLLATGHDPAPVRIIAVESEPPFDVAVYHVDEDVLDAGMMLVRSRLQLLKDCRRKRRWPGAYPQEESLEFPEWALPADTDYTNAIEVLA